MVVNSEKIWCSIAMESIWSKFKQENETYDNVDSFEIIIHILEYFFLLKVHATMILLHQIKEITSRSWMLSICRIQASYTLQQTWTQTLTTSFHSETRSHARMLAAEKKTVMTVSHIWYQSFAITCLYIYGKNRANDKYRKDFGQRTFWKLWSTWQNKKQNWKK